MTATLQMLLDEGIGLRYWCPGRPDRPCGHSDVLDSKTLAAVLGSHQRIDQLWPMIICPKCGGMQVQVQPDWPSPGVIVRPVP